MVNKENFINDNVLLSINENVINHVKKIKWVGVLNDILNDALKLLHGNKYSIKYVLKQVIDL